MFMHIYEYNYITNTYARTYVCSHVYMHTYTYMYMQGPVKTAKFNRRLLTTETVSSCEETASPVLATIRGKLLKGVTVTERRRIKWIVVGAALASFDLLIHMYVHTFNSHVRTSIQFICTYIHLCMCACVSYTRTCIYICACVCYIYVHAQLGTRMNESRHKNE